MYKDAALNCVRYLGYTSLDQVDRLTISEYELLMEGVQLKLVDMDYRNHLQAYLNFAVQATKKSGKNKRVPVYKKFKQFYDYKKELEDLKMQKKEKSRFAGFGKFLKKGE